MIDPNILDYIFQLLIQCQRRVKEIQKEEELKMNEKYPGKMLDPKMMALFSSLEREATFLYKRASSLKWGPQY